MDLGPLRALASTIVFDTHGVDVTVTRPGQDPIETRGIWLTYTNDAVPRGAAFARSGATKVMALPKATVATVPRGTFLEAPPPPGFGSAVETWRVDSHDSEQADRHHVFLVPTTEAS